MKLITGKLFTRMWYTVTFGVLIVGVLMPTAMRGVYLSDALQAQISMGMVLIACLLCMKYLGKP